MTLFVPFRARLLAIFHDRTKLEQTRLKKKRKKVQQQFGWPLVKPRSY